MYSAASYIGKLALRGLAIPATFEPSARPTALHGRSHVAGVATLKTQPRHEDTRAKPQLRAQSPQDEVVIQHLFQRTLKAAVQGLGTVRLVLVATVAVLAWPEHMPRACCSAGAQGWLPSAPFIRRRRCPCSATAKTFDRAWCSSRGHT
eukprot:jgi/Ulvmu1/3887/UM018_0108.1